MHPVLVKVTGIIAGLSNWDTGSDSGDDDEGQAMRGFTWFGMHCYQPAVPKSVSALRSTLLSGAGQGCSDQQEHRMVSWPLAGIMLHSNSAPVSKTIGNLTFEDMSFDV